MKAFDKFLQITMEKSESHMLLSDNIGIGFQMPNKGLRLQTRRTSVPDNQAKIEFEARCNFYTRRVCVDQCKGLPMVET